MANETWRSIVEPLIARYLADAGEKGSPAFPLARSIGALPLLSEMTGCYLARPDGRIIFAEWGAGSEPEVETDQRVQNLALAEGARRYPELAALVPQRPATAVNCSYCGGTGIFPGVPVEGVRCYCGGLGWIPG